MQNTLGQQNIQAQPVNMQASAQPPVQNYGQPYAQPYVSGQSAVNVPAGYSGVNIQIFNPSVTPPGAAAPVYNVNAPNYSKGCYPSEYYTKCMCNNQQNGLNGTNGANGTDGKDNSKKTEKRKIVQLTDDYIRNLENYLNSQDKEVRLMGAKEVFARLDEDHSRCDDRALNALVNKMLQDPSTPVRLLAMSALDSRIATGDDFTVQLLKQMQNSTAAYGQDALQATNILLKMSGQTVEKEFEVKESDKKENKTDKKAE